MPSNSNELDELSKIAEMIFIRGISYHALHGLEFDRNAPLIQAMQDDAKSKINALIQKEVKTAYERGYNSGYVGAKRGRSKRGEGALISLVKDIVDERLKALNQASLNKNGESDEL